MLLYPLYPVSITLPDDEKLMVFADHPDQSCGSVYVLLNDNCTDNIMSILLACSKARDAIVDMGVDFLNYRKFVKSDPFTNESNVMSKITAYASAAAFCDNLSIHESVLKCGVHVDPQTLEESFHLHIYGEDVGIPLRRFSAPPNGVTYDQDRAL